MKYILSIDQGTSSTRTIIFDQEGRQVGSHQLEHKQYYPHPAWVEHDPLEIWENTQRTMREALSSAGLSFSDIASIGITNQRETVVAWNRTTGLPLHNAIVWQCRRTAPRVRELEEYKDMVQQKTGLVLDAYFSGTKMEWLLKNSEKVSSTGSDLAFGTIDSWIAFKLTGRHVTEASNASRTMVYNIHKKQWDDELTELLSVPEHSLPVVEPNGGEPFGLFKEGGNEIPVSGILGDQQAALFGQTCFREGELKNTYGTGNFTLLNTGAKAVLSQNGLLTTIGWQIEDKMTYALEGSVFVTGASIRWLRDNLKFINSYGELDSLASPSSEGVFFVPAFVGLGAPYWDSSARALLIGMTGGTERGHILKAAIDAIAFQTQDLLSLMESEAGVKLNELHVDGGLTRSKILMQVQADVSGLEVIVPRERETTALGAAMMAGLGSVWGDLEELQGLNPAETTFSPSSDHKEISSAYKTWKRAVDRSLKWVE